MSDSPWTGDACSLVDAFRAGERSPVEELQATLAAIEASDLNCFARVDAERAMAAARQADVAKPFGGVPTGIKELEPVARWPYTEASLVFKDRVATYTSHHVERLLADGGIVPVGHTCASEFGGAERQRVPHQRRDPQPVAPGSHRGRLVRRIGLGRGRRPRLSRDRR